MSGKILILLALLFLLVSVLFGVQSYMFVNRSVKAEARVKSIDKAKKWITPTFEYTVKGKTYEFEGSSTSPDAYKIGDTEVIYYNPLDPQDSKIGTFMNLWFIPVFCGGFFIILISVGSALAFSKNPNRLFI
jgi:hypothetical protein